MIVELFQGHDSVGRSLRHIKAGLLACTGFTLLVGAGLLAAAPAQAGVNVPCGNGAKITTTLFGGDMTGNTCGNNVAITTTGSKGIAGGNETNNTNGIYFAMNNPHSELVFGTGLTVDAKGDYVSGIRINGIWNTWGVYTVRVGDGAKITMTGAATDGINVAQSANGDAGTSAYGRAILGNNSMISVANGTAVRVNLTSAAGVYNLAYLGINSVITAGGAGANLANTQGYAVFAGNRDYVVTNGKAKGTDAVVVIGSGASISTTGDNGFAVFANKGGVVQLQGGSVKTAGVGADALRAEKKPTADNVFNMLGGRIELAGDMTVEVAQTDTANALHTLGAGSEISSTKTNYYYGTEDKLYDGAGTVNNVAAKVTTATSGVYSITGNMFAESGLIDLSMKDGSVFTGATKLGTYTYKDASNADVTDAKGTINLKIDGSTSVWNMTANSEATSVTLNGSTLNYVAPTGDVTAPASYKTLTVNTFVGDNGTLVLNTFLGADASASDRLVIDGGSASGSTRLQINNTDPAKAGAQTTADGIMVVQAINGATTGAIGTFALSGRVVAGNGVYEYFLHQGGNAATGGNTGDQNWYLRSVVDEPVVTPPSTGGGGVDPGVVTEITPVRPPLPNVVRPEIIVATAIQPLALEYGYAILDTLHERVGETSMITVAPVTEERIVSCGDRSQNYRCKVRVQAGSTTGVGKNDNRWAASGWARLFGDYGRNEPKNYEKNGPSYNYTLGGIQAGLDIFAHESPKGELDKLGMYVGYGQITSDVTGPYGFEGRKVIGKAGTIDLDAYTVGGYWTHVSPTGWYTDAVVQGTWYSGSAHSILNQGVSPDGVGILGSLEGGYAFKFGNGYTLEPQAQIIYQNVSFDNARDAFGRFTFDDGDSMRGRLGLRLTKTWNGAENGMQARLITGWLRANIWHEFMGQTTTKISGINGGEVTPFSSNLEGTWGELGAGITAQMTDKVNVFATGAYNRSLDNKGREGWDGRLGMTVKW